MKRIISVAAALSAIALTAAACGGATTTPKATTPTTAPITAAAKAREGATFLKLVAPYNAERAKLDADKATPTTTAGLQAFLAPLVKASNTLAAALQHAGFTGPAATPALTMAISVEAVVADIQSATISNWPSEKTVIAGDEKTVNGEDKVLRATLGLPTATS
jgi:hypothetical protein